MFAAMIIKVGTFKMIIKVGTFNLNNLFSRFNFSGAIDEIAGGDSRDRPHTVDRCSCQL